MPPDSIAASIRAAVACAGRGVERAVRERASQGFAAADMAMYAAAHRRRLGVLLGGDEGKRLASEATSAMRAESIMDPDRRTDLLAPGSALV